MRVLPVLVISALSSGSVLGAFEPKCSSPAAASLGGLFASARSSSTDTTQGSRFSFLYSPGLFNLPELGRIQARYARRSGSSGFSLSLSRFGGPLYRESEAAFGAEFDCDTLKRIGAEISLMHLGIAGYGTALACGLSISGGVEAASGVLLRFAAVNLLAGRVGGEPIPRLLACGAAWRPADGFALNIEARLESGVENAWSGGVEWEMMRGIFLRLGVSTDHPGIDGGAGVAVGGIVFSYAFRWHRDLGGSHFLGVEFESPV